LSGQVSEITGYDGVLDERIVHQPRQRTARLLQHRALTAGRRMWMLWSK
jgi:hypothetical protein